MNEGIIGGVEVDRQGRCKHWGGPDDIVAFRFPCCDKTWACRDCHDALADHKALVWPAAARFEVPVICGACRSRISIDWYLGRDADACPHCQATWNPGCRKHHARYFEVG